MFFFFKFDTYNSQGKNKNSEIPIKKIFSYDTFICTNLFTFNRKMIQILERFDFFLIILKNNIVK